MLLAWGEIAVLTLALVALMTVNHAWPSVALVFYQAIGLFINLYQIGLFSPRIEANPLRGREMLAGIALIRLMVILMLMVGTAQFEAARATSKSASAGTQPPPPVGPVPQEVSAEVADELRKLAALVAEGVITKEEFEAKKRKVLGI